MPTPRWLKRNVILIFCLVLAAALIALAVCLTLAVVDQGLSSHEMWTFLAIFLAVGLAALARIKPLPPDDRPGDRDKGDLPTGPIEVPAAVIATVTRLPPPAPYRSSSTTYQIDGDDEPPKARVLQIPRRRVSGDDPVPSPSPPKEFDWGLAMREDTGGFPPVPPGREEAT